MIPVPQVCRGQPARRRAAGRPIARATRGHRPGWVPGGCGGQGGRAGGAAAGGPARCDGAARRVWLQEVAVVFEGTLRPRQRAEAGGRPRLTCGRQMHCPTCWCRARRAPPHRLAAPGPQQFQALASLSYALRRRLPSKPTAPFYLSTPAAFLKRAGKHPGRTPSPRTVRRAPLVQAAHDPSLCTCCRSKHASRHWMEQGRLRIGLRPGALWTPCPAHWGRSGPRSWCGHRAAAIPRV
jgi:hypothetical protein